MKRRARQKQPFFERRALRFECTRCGACCTGGPDEHVFVSDGEAHDMAASLRLSWRWFSRRYLTRLTSGERVVQMTSAGACVFLRDGRCRVYAARPSQCRTYPFWPELLNSATAWQRESRRCEGIGRGARVPLTVIRAALESGNDPEGEA